MHVSLGSVYAPSVWNSAHVRRHTRAHPHTHDDSWVGELRAGTLCDVGSGSNFASAYFAHTSVRSLMPLCSRIMFRNDLPYVVACPCARVHSNNIHAHTNTHAHARTHTRTRPRAEGGIMREDPMNLRASFAYTVCAGVCVCVHTHTHTHTLCACTVAISPLFAFMRNPDTSAYDYDPLTCASRRSLGAINVLLPPPSWLARWRPLDAKISL